MHGHWNISFADVTPSTPHWLGMYFWGATVPAFGTPMKRQAHSRSSQMSPWHGALLHTTGSVLDAHCRRFWEHFKVDVDEAVN